MLWKLSKQLQYRLDFLQTPQVLTNSILNHSFITLLASFLNRMATPQALALLWMTAWIQEHCGEFHWRADTAHISTLSFSLSLYLECEAGKEPKEPWVLCWGWVNMDTVGWTSINPSYDLGWTKGTRVLTHPHIATITARCSFEAEPSPVSTVGFYCVCAWFLFWFVTHPQFGALQLCNKRINNPYNTFKNRDSWQFHWLLMVTVATCPVSQDLKHLFPAARWANPDQRGQMPEKCCQAI